MRVKKDFLVVSFPTTAAAMACESLCAEKGLPGRTIPVPSQISAGCGLAWRILVPVSGMDVVPLWVLVKE